MAIRVVHIGTGYTGLSALKAVLVDPALELVGWWVNSPEKEGIDAGEICGLANTGVLATRDLDAVLALDADCLVYAGHAAGRELEASRDIARFLERGTNVVTFAIISMIYPPAGPSDIRKLIDAACVKGGTTFYATGSEPGIFSMSIPATLLSGAGRLDNYREQQFVLDYVGVYGVEEPMRESMGFGKPEGTVPQRFTDGTVLKWWRPNILCLADFLGVTVDDFEFVWETCLSDRTIDTHIGRFEKGTIGGYHWELHGLVGGRRAITIEYVAWLTPDIVTPSHWPRPAPDTRDAAVVYRIDGEPSFKTQMYLETPAGGRSASIPMTALHATNAIPQVIAAEAGITYALKLPYYATRNVGSRRQ